MKTVVISMIAIMIIKFFPSFFFYLTNPQINYKISNNAQI